MHDCVHGYAVDTTYQDEERGGVMIVGCPKEIKNEEYRVSMTPNGVKDFVSAGHTVIV